MSDCSSWFWITYKNLEDIWYMGLCNRCLLNVMKFIFNIILRFFFKSCSISKALGTEFFEDRYLWGHYYFYEKQIIIGTSKLISRLRANLDSLPPGFMFMKFIKMLCEVHSSWHQSMAKEYKMSVCKHISRSSNTRHRHSKSVMLF